jgi:hypothetical protein
MKQFSTNMKKKLKSEVLVRQMGGSEWGTTHVIYSELSRGMEPDCRRDRTHLGAHMTRRTFLRFSGSAFSYSADFTFASRSLRRKQLPSRGLGSFRPAVGRGQSLHVPPSARDPAFRTEDQFSLLGTSGTYDQRCHCRLRHTLRRTSYSRADIFSGCDHFPVNQYS